MKYEQDIDGSRYYFDWDYHMVTGWVTWDADKTRTYFGSDGAALSGWQDIGGKRYYFDPANAYHGKRWEQTIDGKFYYFDSDCSMVTGWVTWYADKSKTLFGDDGAALTGWQSSGGKTYYLSPATFKSVKYEQDIDGSRYYFDWDYHMVTGWVTWDADKTRTYFGSDGAALSGWQDIGGKRYYFDPANAYHGKRWEQTIDGKFYYFDSDCSMVTGWVTWYADKSKTLFGDDGAALTGWQSSGGKTYYLSPTTFKSVKYEQTIDGKFYYFDWDYSMYTGPLTWNKDKTTSFFGVDGVMVDGGWQTWKGKKYYIDPVTHRAVKWEQTIDGKQYYFDSDCSMYVGLITWGKDGSKSFYGSDGVMASGWQSWKGKTYYINPSTMRAVKWEQTINGQFYYFDDNCAMYNKGWLRWGADGSWSYFPSNGIRYTGWHTIDGVSYNFGSNGKCTTYNPFISDMAGRAQGYWSGTGYLIMVDRSTHRVGIFTGSRYNWRAIKWFSCVTGAWSTPTITGSYQTTGYKKPCLSTDSRARYATQIYGGYFFHTILASNNELGQNLSHGCIRLAVPDAQWIYNNIGGGTRVVIYN